MTLSGTGTTQRGSTTVAPMPCAASRSATCRPSFAIGPTVTISTSLCGASRSTSTPSSVRRTASNSLPTLALREAHDGRGVVDDDRLAQLLAQARGVARRGDADVRHDLQDREIPHAVVAGAVRPGDAGAVEHEGDAGLVQRDIHQHLVEGAVHEGRVQRDDRVQSAEGETGRRGDGVLLGDADVEHAVGVLLGELVQAGRAQHRGGDADDRRVAVGERAPSRRRRRWSTMACSRPRSARRSPGRSGRPRGTGRRRRQGRLVAAALLGDGVHDDRRAVVLRLRQRLLERAQVVAVDRAEVLDVEVRVQRLVVGEAGEEAVRAAADAAVERAAGRAEEAGRTLRLVEYRLR